MIGIFLDNYRGFSHQFIELQDVNFLVGENSTGKTSFLSIIKLMSNPSFWIDTDFNDDNLRLGSFNELINSDSKNKKTFTIGFFVSQVNDQEDKEPHFRLLTFRNEEGLPVVSKHSFIVDGYLVTTVIRKDKLLYKRHEIDVLDASAHDVVNICFTEHNSISSKGYKRIVAKGFPRKLFFAHADKLVAASFEGEDYFESRKSFSVFLRTEFPRVSWIAPIRAKPESTYEGYNNHITADGEHIPHLLNKIISKSKTTGKSSELIDAINKFGISSGLFEYVDTKRFGKDLSSPFEMHVIINGKTLKVCNVGYGISQVLPVVTEILARNDKPIFLIQQPEVHLHPKAQAALGEFIYEEVETNKSRFLVETHSDYLIDRFRLKKNKNDNDSSTCQVLFFEREGTSNKVYSIVIDDNGSYPLEQPSAFRDFFLNEELDLLRL